VVVRVKSRRDKRGERISHGNGFGKRQAGRAANPFPAVSIEDGYPTKEHQSGRFQADAALQAETPEGTSMGITVGSGQTLSVTLFTAPIFIGFREPTAIIMAGMRGWRASRAMHQGLMLLV
jgi:hypothetical protein